MVANLERGQERRGQALRPQRWLGRRLEPEGGPGAVRTLAEEQGRYGLNLGAGAGEWTGMRSWTQAS